MSILVAVAGCSSRVFGENIATCQDLAGYSYFHEYGLVPKGKDGFQNDKLSDALTTLVRLSENKFDLLFVDARKSIISTLQSGGDVRMLRHGTNDATFLVFYQGMVIELYTFYRDDGGKIRYDLLQSKGGDGMPIHKSSVLTGDCSELNLSILP